MNLDEIRARTAEFSRRRGFLARKVEELEAEVERLRRKAMPQIRNLVEATANARAELEAAIGANPQLFERPRTLIIDGVKVGLQKGKGGISFTLDEDVVVRLIEKHFPQSADVLIRTTKKPVKAALAELPAADLKKIGVAVTDTGDQVLIKPTDSEIDKLVAALLKDAGDRAAADGEEAV